MKNSIDTIAAIATAPGQAGIAIVRVSGPNSLQIADAVFSGNGPPPSKRRPNSFVRGFVKSEHGGTCVDEVILLIYHAPHSYTREDVVEFQGHGGAVSAQRILRAVLQAGAKPAEPGEFTKRAFLSGRIDLLQAEAVADLIAARSARAAAAALEQLAGRLSSVVSAAYDDLVKVAADLEASLDFADDELPQQTLPDIVSRLQAARDRLKEILGTWQEGHLLREGALAVICGGPNVGKSTLMNLLLGSDRAIVTDIPGTTRDTIEESLIFDGIPIRLVDTAGLRDTDCTIERQGVQRAESSIERADIVLYMIDCSQPLTPEDHHRLASLDPQRSLVILNKTDLGIRVTKEQIPGPPVVSSSLLTGQGVDQIRGALLQRLGFRREAPPHAVISERHRHAIELALRETDRALKLMGSGQSEDTILAATALRDGLEQLGTVTGRNFSNDLLDSIFQRFCVGK